MSKLKDSRLYIYNDAYCNEGFVIKTSELTFARVNHIEGKWRIWYYTRHLQEDFVKFKDALRKIETEFVKYFRGKS